MTISATVSGSFKFLNYIHDRIREFERDDVKVLSPKLSRPISHENGFTRLEGDIGLPFEVELKHLEAILKSDFLYVVNPRGYIGPSVALEIGFALSRNIPVFSTEKPTDPVFASLIRSRLSIPEIKKTVSSAENSTQFFERGMTLSDLQRYVGEMVKAKGFEEETTSDAMLLFVEEVGELAKALRENLGLKVRENRSRKSDLRAEVADCIMYLLDIANLTGIDLQQALRKKISADVKAKWTRPVQKKS